MPSIVIRDLARSTSMDSRAMSAVRGGVRAPGDVTVNVELNQQFVQFQQIGVDVLNNNGVIGAGLVGPDFGVAAAEWKQNRTARTGL